jgi:type IV secretion system protein VirB5|tara:strand:- start:201 stop:1037 length:837 start_codon:yes stop_codon:yes gene_type:complete
MEKMLNIGAMLRSTVAATIMGAGVAMIGVTAATPADAQGVPTVDVQNIAQEINQLRQMIEDEVLQNEQLTQLLSQLDTLREQYAQLQETYAALTGLAELPEIISAQMEDGLNGMLDQEFGDILGTIEAIQNGDWSQLTGNASPQIRTQMTRVLAEAGFDEDTLSEMANSGTPGAARTATQATTGAAVSAAAQTSYEEAGQSLERVDRLVGMIGSMEDLKASVDLNTRVTAELAIAMVAMWQLEAVQTVGTGQAGVIDAATLAEEQRYMDFTLPTLSAD